MLAPFGSAFGQMYGMVAIGRSKITAGDYKGTTLGFGLRKSMKHNFSVEIQYAKTSASRFSSILESADFNDEYIEIIRLESQNNSNQSVQNGLKNYKEYLDRVSFNFYRIGLTKNVLNRKRHQIGIGAYGGLAIVEVNEINSWERGEFYSNLGSESKINLIELFSARFLDVNISPFLQYSYNVTPRSAVCLRGSFDQLIYSGQYNFNYQILYALKLN